MEGHVFVHPPCLESSDPCAFDCGLMTSLVPLLSGQDNRRNQRQKWHQEGYKVTHCHLSSTRLAEKNDSCFGRHRVGYPSHQERERRTREA